MSVVFEGVVFLSRGRCRGLISSFLNNDVAFEELGEISVVFRTGPRSKALFSEQMDFVAATISGKCDRACLLRVDTRTGFRESRVFFRGEIETTIGSEDEIWVPLDDEGEPIRSGIQLRAFELEEDEEYDTLFDVVYLSLEKLSCGLGEQLRGDLYQFMDGT